MIVGIRRDDKRRQELEKLAEQMRAEMARGTPLGKTIVMLHDRGLSIVESMWVVREITQRSLKDVKMLVTAQPVWEKLVEANEPLHDDLEKFGQQEQDGKTSEGD